MKRIISLLLTVLLLLTVFPAQAAKSKATPTPPPLEIESQPVDPPEKIQQLLDIVYNEWVTVNGKDQGVKNKYTTWFNKYNWGRNSWCAGFVTWCMLEAEIPQLTQDELKEAVEEGSSPEPIFHVKGSAPKKMAPGYLYMHRTSHIPQKGFIVLYGEKSNKYIHVGFVYDVELKEDGKYRLTCIEGAMKNTVRMFVYDYDPEADQKKNIVLVPKEERTEEESKIFTYGNHKSGTSWYVNCFLTPWIPGDDNL